MKTAKVLSTAALTIVFSYPMPTHSRHNLMALLSTVATSLRQNYRLHSEGSGAEASGWQ